jgi:thioesterase DpgC
MKQITPATTLSLSEQLENLKNWYNIERELLGNFPLPIERNIEDKKKIRSFFDRLGEERARLVASYANEIYAAVTSNFSESVRVEDLVYRIAENFPGLAPTKLEVAEDDLLLLGDKHGHEISQGLILSALLAEPAIGRHLLNSMQLPKEKSIFLLNEFQQQNFIEFETLTLTRHHNVAYINLSNQSSLNAEDDQLNSDMESAVDVILLSPDVEIAVIRGGIMNHEKYKGKRVFCSGINLTKLYHGQISYLFYVTRELGLITKIYRGLCKEKINMQPQELVIEKPWISVVDSHAIGGGFQMLLVSDFVIAESGCILSVPARREGFIPGLTNLRLPRFVGQRLANKLVYKNYRIVADSVEGKQIVDEVVPSKSMDDALNKVISDINEFGISGFVSNRKAFRLGIESVELFLNYMSSFCREQVKCMYGHDVVNNLETFWQNRYSSHLNASK